MAGHIQENVDDDAEDDTVIQQRLEAELASSEVSQLSDVSEESDKEDESSQISQPSQFPSGLVDHSYNYERGVRRIQPIQIRTHAPRPFTPIKKLCQKTKEAAVRAATSIAKTAGVVSNTSRRMLVRAGEKSAVTTHSALKSLSRIPLSTILSIMALTLALTLAAGTFAATVCFLYQRIGCNVIPSTGLGLSVHSGLQTICGDCANSAATFDFSNIASEDIAKISSTLNSINNKIQDLERRLSYRIDANQAALEKDLLTLKHQQNALSNHLADHVDEQSGSTGGNVASPLMPKINFFAPDNGATIDLYRTTPTKARYSHVLSRIVKRLLGLTRHDINPPTTALTAWQDVGDCWCAANAPTGQDFVRLAILTKEMMYPTELIIEHYPASGNPFRQTTPRRIELWADFGHMDEDEWKMLELHNLQEGNVLGPTYAKIGSMKYDATGRTSHLQTGVLDVNQFGMFHYAQKYVVRVISNHGGNNVCMYRVRLHGHSFDAPDVGNVDEWYQKQGYETEDN